MGTGCNYSFVDHGGYHLDILQQKKSNCSGISTGECMELRRFDKLRIAKYPYLRSFLAFSIFSIDYKQFFLYLLCFGIALQGASIIPLSFVHWIYFQTSATCHWDFGMFQIGLGITCSTLMAKTYRINKIMASSKKCRRVTITVAQTLYPVVINLCSTFRVFKTYRISAHFEIFAELRLTTHVTFITLTNFRNFFQLYSKYHLVIVDVLPRSIDS